MSCDLKKIASCTAKPRQTKINEKMRNTPYHNLEESKNKTGTMRTKWSCSNNNLTQKGKKIDNTILGVP